MTFDDLCVAPETRCVANPSSCPSAGSPDVLFPYLLDEQCCGAGRLSHILYNAGPHQVLEGFEVSKSAAAQLSYKCNYEFARRLKSSLDQDPQRMLVLAALKLQ